MRTGKLINISIKRDEYTGYLFGNRMAIELIWRKVNNVALNNHRRTLLTILTQTYI